ncbi:Pre-mRNA-splicing factor Cwf15/Cwc15 [Powellomyces hirtus]|nr:Pre-mRNA-splicing factor Cwf15/Cwc15 [Powellomyces hirtus]
MTTAARPTWHPAVGGHSLRDTNSAPTHNVSSRDLATQTHLKLRQPGQNAPGDISELLMKERLAEKERLHFAKSQGKNGREVVAEDEPFERPKIEGRPNIDADDSDSDNNDGDGGGSESDSSSDDDDDDDEAELLRELEKIRRERAEEKERLEHERQEEDERNREAEALTGNPLLDANAPVRDFSVKRRWDDDVVFKNQSKGHDENPKKRFINDVLRSDFHRKFMGKYVR